MSAVPRCCEHDMREVRITTPAPTGLVAYLCGRCHQSQWRRDGIPVTKKQALETAVAIDGQLESTR